MFLKVNFESIYFPNFTCLFHNFGSHNELCIVLDTSNIDLFSDRNRNFCCCLWSTSQVHREKLDLGVFCGSQSSPLYCRCFSVGKPVWRTQ